MKKTYTTTALLFSGLVAFTGTPAYASDSNTGWASGLYATANVGQARFDNDTLNAAENAGLSLDDTDIGYSAGVGYEFNKYVAFEAGYVNLGEANINLDGGGFFDQSWEADAFYLGPKVSLSVTDKFSVFGKIGLFSWDVDYSPSTNDPILAQFLSPPETYNGADIYFGAGFAYVVTNTISITAEWIRLNFDSDGRAFPDTDINFISAGLVFKFGKFM